LLRSFVRPLRSRAAAQIVVVRRGERIASLHLADSLPPVEFDQDSRHSARRQGLLPLSLRHPTRRETRCDMFATTIRFVMRPANWGFRRPNKLCEAEVEFPKSERIGSTSEAQYQSPRDRQEYTIRGGCRC